MLFHSTLTYFYALALSALLAAAMPGNFIPDTNPTVTVTVTATPPAAPTAPASQCNTGPIQCCNSVQKANSPSVTTLLGLLGIVVSDITALVGITCSPITAIGLGGNSCTAQPVCCQNNNFNGLIAIGCLPISL